MDWAERKRARDQIRARIYANRECMHRADYADRMRLLALGVYYDEAEALDGLVPHPDDNPPTEADIDAWIADMPESARLLRRYVEENGHVWPEHERWQRLVVAEEIEDRYGRLTDERNEP